MARYTTCRCAGLYLPVSVLVLVAGSLTAAPPDVAKRVGVRVDSEILSLDEAVLRASTDQKRVSYRQMREALDRTPAGQLELARWCRKQGLEVEERLHWRILLRINPEHLEAVRALGLQKFQGTWLSKEQIAQLKREKKQAKAAERKWQSRLKRIKLAIEHGDAAERKSALDQLQTIDDPHAMPLVADLFSDSDAELGLLVVEMLSGIAAQQATDTLVRFAVHAADAEVRRKAASLLGYRPRESYVPALIAGLAAPIELNAHVDRESGRPVYESYRGYAESGRIVVGLYGVVRLHTQYTNNDVLFWAPETKPFSGIRLSGYVPDRTEYVYTLTQESPDPNAPYEYTGVLEALSGPGARGRELESMRGAVMRLETQVMEANAAAIKLNARIYAALLEAIGLDAAPAAIRENAPTDDVHPRVWWDWWRKELRLNNYLARGTEVWTETGLGPIEKVRVGDRILTRDSNTDELAFELVIGIDTQTQTVMHEIVIGSRTILATPEQPFFLADGLWRAAEKLEPGMKLHSLTGPIRIDRITPANGDVTFSLLVEKAANYFVDWQGVLVHDATRHLPTSAR